jgi:hypothetical protein
MLKVLTLEEMDGVVGGENIEFENGGSYHVPFEVSTVIHIGASAAKAMIEAGSIIISASAGAMAGAEAALSIVSEANLSTMGRVFSGEPTSWQKQGCTNPYDCPGSPFDKVPNDPTR